MADSGSDVDGTSQRIDSYIDRANHLLAKANQEIEGSVSRLIAELKEIQTQAIQTRESPVSRQFSALSPVRQDNGESEQRRFQRPTSRRRFITTIWQFGGTDKINAEHWNGWVSDRRRTPAHAKRRNVPGSNRESLHS